MSALAELIPQAKSLSRTDQLRLIQLLPAELASDEGSEINASNSYEVWSPDSAFAAADIMLQAIADEGNGERTGDRSRLCAILPRPSPR